MSEIIQAEPTFYRARQQRLATMLRDTGCVGALVTAAENVQYLTGHRPVRHKPGAAWVEAAGAVHLGHAEGDRKFESVDGAVAYEASRGGTLVDFQVGEAIAALAPVIAPAGKVGFDALPPGGLRAQVNIAVELIGLRRTKDALEVRLLQESIAGIEAIYEHIRKVLRAGMTELDVCAECHAVAVRVTGGPIGWLGNDFQSGSGGGPPRNRRIEDGELLPLDLGLGANGYIADMCRTFCVGNAPTVQQQRAHARVCDVLDRIVPQLKPGAQCADLHRQAIEHLEGFDGLRFGHHLGHGIGLNAHEQPRVNINWNDTLAVGDVITIEPGLYGQSISGGVRLENDYLITESGCRPLSNHPLHY